MKPKDIWGLLKAIFSEWNFKEISLLAAALAYYTVFSLAPLLILVVTLLGVVFGEAAVEGELVNQIQGLVGESGAEAIQVAIANTQEPNASQGPFGLPLTLASLLFGASNVFAQMQIALNRVWEVKPQPGRNIFNFLRKRLLSFSMILVIAFLLLVSFVIDALLAGSIQFLSGYVPGLGYLWQILDFGVSFGVITLLFAWIYKVLPDAQVAWQDVGVGAALTALLFLIGQFCFGIFLGQVNLGSTYGVAGSLVIVITWTYYATHILLFGAEFTEVYAKWRGVPIVPAEYAIRIQQTVEPPSSSQQLDKR